MIADLKLALRQHRKSPAFTLTALNQQITSYTEFWPMVLGLILIVLLYAFPAGILGTLVSMLGGHGRRTDA